MPNATRRAVRSSRVALPAGFRFAESRTDTYSSRTAFFDALERQRDAYVTVPARTITHIDIEGRVQGNDGFRLTSTAFDDVCRMSRVPTAFVKSLAKRNESLAMTLLEDALAAVFHRVNEGAVLLVDSSTGQVDGVTESALYNPITNAEVMNLAITANDEMEFTRGWLDGPASRMALTSERSHSVKVGDIVQVGVSVENSMAASAAAVVRDYAERLKCANGMTAQDGMRRHVIEHQGRDSLDELIPVLVRSGARARQFIPMMKRAAEYFLDVKGVRSIRKFLRDPRQGGGAKLEEKATRGAVAEALDDGRSAGEICLWDYVNGVTAAAKDAVTLERRRRTESVGHTLLTRVLEPAS